MYDRFDLLKVSSGCNCCEVSGNLVTDGTTWKENGKVYGRFGHVLFKINSFVMVIKF